MNSNIRLRQLKIDDLSYMYEWMTDDNITKWFQFSRELIEKGKIESFIKRAQTELKEKQDVHFAIVDQTDEYLGTISLKNIDLSARKAEYAIVLRSKAIGKGVGKAATKLILKKAFEEWKMNRIYLNVLPENKRAIEMYKKLGFQFEGEFKNHICIEGRINSLKWFAILKEEWKVMYGD